jgi:hypothetical protein
MPPFSAVYVFDIFVLTLCLATSIPVYATFIRRFSYHPAYAIFPVVLNCLSAIWIWSLIGRAGGDELLAQFGRPHMYLVCWWLMCSFINFFYVGYRDEFIPMTISNTQILVALMAMPIVGIFLTAVWLFWTKKRWDTQLASKGKMSLRERLFNTSLYLVLPPVVLFLV